MGQVRFDGQAVIVTGAGGGLGRDFAIAFAKRGALVVVNDLGGGRSGEGGGARMADKVVEEIRSLGGKAVPNYDSVENGSAIVETAIKHFGRIDVVVNNAGILRDKSMAKMSELDWDLIHRVHLKGSWSVCRAAWPYMRKQQYGRIINTSSNSGIYGNFGQANYSAAKMGLIGLTNTLAIEGAKSNILANAYIPTAGSRLTEDVMPAETWRALRTDYAVPLVLFLASKECPDSGGVFEAAAGWFGQLQWYRSKGVAFGKNGATVEQVRDAWDRIKDMTNSRHFSDGTEVVLDLVEQLESKNGEANSLKAMPAPSAGTNPALAKAHKFETSEYDYTSKDAILYALGVGAETEGDLRYLYESEEGFAVLPTFVVVPGLGATAGIASSPGLNVDFSKLLHGEQYLELYAPIPPSGRLISEAKIADVLDKGSGAAVLLDVTQKDGSGKAVSRAQYTIFLRGEGAFGGPRSSSSEIPCLPPPKRFPSSAFPQKAAQPPDGAADAIVKQPTSVEQPALYRQASGDYNPIHIDPSFATISGFKKPIMHGLCTLGYAVRHVLKTYADNKVDAFKAVKVVGTTGRLLLANGIKATVYQARFSKPVYPGQTLVTEMWKEGNRIHFQTKVEESGDVAISGAYVDLKADASSGNSGSSDSLNSQVVFDELEKRLKAQPELVKKVNAIFLWVITKNGKEAGKWTVDLKNAGGKIYKGDPTEGAKPGVTLTLDDDHMAFMSGKLKLKGNIMLTQKLQALLKDQAKL